MLSDFLTPQVLAYIAGGLFVIAYLLINQILLRVAVMAGTVFYIWYYAVAAETPLWEAIYMSLLMGAANLIGLGQLLYGRSRWAVPRAHRDIYGQFGGLPPGDFRALVSCARRIKLDAGTCLTSEGQDVHHLTYVISGALSIEKRGERFAMPAGTFVGEVAYMTGGRSSASVHAGAPIEVLQWDFDVLRRRSQRNSRFKLALEAMISGDMALKVAFAVAPHAMTQDQQLAAQPRGFKASSVKSAAQIFR